MHRISALLVLAAGTVAAVTAAVSPAFANNCPAQTASIQSLRPADGATGVPLNGVIAFGTLPAFAPYDPAVTLTSGGNVVAGGLISGPGGTWIFRPDAPLAPNTTYEVEILDESTAGGSAASASFTTGSAQDLTDPTPPTNVKLTLPEYVDPSEVDGCSKPGYWRLHVTWDPASDETPLLYALEVDLTDLQPEFANTPYKGVITTANEADVGVPQDSAADVFVYAIDGAGRQSHSQVASIVVPVPPKHTHRNSCDVDVQDAGEVGGALPRAAIGIALLAAALLVARKARSGA